MNLLLISNSTNPGEAYLSYPRHNIREFLGPKPLDVLFIPYAAVTFSYDLYEEKVSERFRETGHRIVSVHHFPDPVRAVREAEAIAVGGGNTWKLLKNIRENKLIGAVREKVMGGTPYVGWSAGANMACPTIMTTNDMPVTRPASFRSFNLVPFQINPHYLDANPEGHAGETREQRIIEFIEMNPGIYVVGLREGTMLEVRNGSIRLIGPRKARIFKKGITPVELGDSDDFSWLLKSR